MNTVNDKHVLQEGTVKATFSTPHEVQGVIIQEIEEAGLLYKRWVGVLTSPGMV